VDLDPIVLKANYVVKMSNCTESQRCCLDGPLCQEPAMSHCVEHQWCPIMQWASLFFEFPIVLGAGVIEMFYCVRSQRWTLVVWGLKIYGQIPEDLV